MPATTTARELRFAAGIPGFPDARDFLLEPLDEHGTYLRLRATDGQVTFTAARPGAFFPDYRVPAEACAGLLDGYDPEQALPLVLLAARADGTVTANLLGPVVVDLATGAAAQVVVDGLPDGSHAVPLPTH